MISKINCKKCWLHKCKLLKRNWRYIFWTFWYEIWCKIRDKWIFEWNDLFRCKKKWWNVFDCDANFKLSDKKIIDCENVIKKIKWFETTNFDFFAWWSRICSCNLIFRWIIFACKNRQSDFFLFFCNSNFFDFFVDLLLFFEHTCLLVTFSLFLTNQTNFVNSNFFDFLTFFD